MENNKIITTVIPTFNREQYLKKSIESCLDQTVKHEIIVCNHGGTDGTDEMIKQFQGKIKYIKKEKDNGPNYCWLDGVMEAKGDFINLLFDDDWIDQNYVENCMKFIDDPKVGFVFTPAKIYDDDAHEVTDIQHNNYLFKDGIYEVSKYELDLLYSLISPSAFIIRKKDMIASLYNGQLPFAQHEYKGVGPDRLMILLCMLRYPRFGFVKKPHVYFRKHINSITVDSHLDEKKKILIKRAYDEVDKYYYMIKYGRIFSFLHNIYIFRIRYLLNHPISSFKKIIMKLTKKLKGN